ncbi:MAG TPA: tyrosine recombinase XerC [Firmicutes bacterium]|jgi:tyrosine recombinase xerC|nr:tyrosine recombinase XerC [Bacillota bacterium]
MEKEIDRFIEYLKYQRNYSDFTCNNYNKDLNEYNSFILSNKINYKNMDYNEAKEYVIYLNKKNDAKSTISRKLSSLRTFYKYLVLNNKVESNPFLLVSSPKKEKRIPKFINYNNMEEILNVPNIKTKEGQRERVILEVLYASGVRVSELVNIKLKDIDFSNKNILILGKGSKERLVSFGDYALEYINLYLKEGRKLLLDGVKSDYLIVGKKSEKLTTRRVEQIIDDIIKRTSIKLNITPHMFRHTFATHLLDNGCDLLVVQELLGHASLSSTEIYTHVSNEHLREVYLKCHPRNKR